MARELRRLLVERPRLERARGRVLLQGQELHYLRRVLRLRPGDPFGVVDGCGHLWSALLELGGARHQGWAVLQQSPDTPLEKVPPARPRLQLAVALPRRDPEVLLRMACELGIDGFQWLRAERSLAEAMIRPERQQAVLRETLEQCERLWLPCCPSPQQALPWLQAATGGMRLLATTRRATARPLGEVLGAPVGQASAVVPGEAPEPMRLEPVWVAIGPEGGWSPQEEQLALDQGWQAVQLGEGILRTSTAAVAAASLLAAWRDGLGLSCGTSPRPSP